MALTDENGGGMVMPVAPMYGNGNNGFGGDESWLILFIILAMSGNWGGFGGGFGNGNMALGYDFPWLLNANNATDALINSGFNQAATAGTLAGIQSSITSGFGDVQNALCGGFAGVNASVNGAQNALAQQLYTNQIAELERSFAAQTANTQAINGIQSQLADCCCENRLATANLGADIAREACADRQAVSEALMGVTAQNTANTNALMNTINGGIQSIKDQLCSDKIEQKNDIIAQLRSELMYARGQASQDVQTASIQAGQRALANEIEQYVAPKPVPAYTVQNPNCCGNYTCGCSGF